jgi:uncharacterized protein (DUF362 family)/Pyruvate/2-oxoacid:ferredoxin oxidoreductase delta subunit
MSKVLVLDSDYGSVGEAVGQVFDAFPLDVAGKNVLVKPNILGPFAPESHVNTSPALVIAVVERLQSDGALVTVGDNPGARGYGAVEKSADVSGIREASLGTFSNLSTPVETVRLRRFDTSVNISKAVLEADVMISLPKFKTHVLTVISGALKNSYGFIVGGEKTRLHRDFSDAKVFSQIVTEVYALRPPDIVIMDGIVGMQGNGPSAKTLYPVGKILASDDGVALDTVMTSMMGIKPSRIEMLTYAASRGLGMADLSKIDVDGDAGPLQDFKKPSSNMQRIIPRRVFEMFYPDLDKASFTVDTEKCTACGKCRDLCPGEAITIKDKLPEYDYSRCVACYCCMELCSEQAIEIEESLRVRIYRKIGLL